MKRKTLLLLVMTAVITSLHAQKNKKAQKLTGYAITSEVKGQTGWKEVRLVNITTGEDEQTIYKNAQEVEILNARTGKPVAKKDMAVNTAPAKKIINLDMELEKKELSRNGSNVIIVRNDYRQAMKVQTDKPFATNSAACAYDEKHERLFYTPMSINQLRYIDLKSKTAKIYYFEDEPFGVVTGPGDVSNQITRMVIASDDNGYALSNNANHLIRFTTGKNIVITDLGALTDDPANGKYSVHSSSGYGGDMVADAKKNLYLITANRNVYRISIESKVATYLGTITGLPRGFSTNGAMVESGSKVIVCSSEQTVGYFRFDLANMQTPAEKVSTSADVFNASDLANGKLAFEKEKKERKKKDEVVQQETKEPVVADNTARPGPQEELQQDNGILVYPNPVTNGVVKLSFSDQPAGKYQVQFLDMSGKLISSQEVTITSKIQVEEFRFPELNVKGSYLVKVFSDVNKVSVVNKIVVQ